MSEMVHSFRTKEDFKISVGPKDQEISIPRVKFKDADAIIDLISQDVHLSTVASIQILQASSGLKATGKDAQRFSELVKEIIPAVLKSRSVTLVEKLLHKLSRGIISQDVIDSLDYEEAVRIVTFLIEKNFESLKNLSASFQAIATQRS